MTKHRIAYYVAIIILLVQGACCSGSHPECRKAGVAVVIPAHSSLGSTNLTENRELDARKLVIWAGKGKGRDTIYESSYSLNLKTLEWSGPLMECKADDNEQIPNSKEFPGFSLRVKPSCQTPIRRWKTFAVYSLPLGGILSWGGSTRPHMYFNDLWLMKASDGGWFDQAIEWERAQIVKNKHGVGHVPVGRRAFGAALLPGNKNGKDGTLAVVFGRDER